jgi:hypothetical protein
MVPPSVGTVACAYDTGDRYGQLIVSVRPMTLDEYQARFESRDPENLAEGAVFIGCGELSVYSEGRVLQLGFQFADCAVLRKLISLGRFALRRLSDIAA